MWTINDECILTFFLLFVKNALEKDEFFLQNKIRKGKPLYPRKWVETRLRSKINPRKRSLISRLARRRKKRKGKTQLYFGYRLMTAGHKNNFNFEGKPRGNMIIDPLYSNSLRKLRAD